MAVNNETKGCGNDCKRSRKSKDQAAGRDTREEVHQATAVRHLNMASKTGLMYFSAVMTASCLTLGHRIPETQDFG